MADAPVCVGCRVHPVDPKYRPFCSERCKLVDLGRWLSEEYRVPTAERPPDPTHGRDADDH
jgi:endogenous inhibitor of DNA gyrase (YacG/DUF329 family)